jgi:hypothetical protein
MKEEHLLLEKAQAIQEQLIRFIYNKIVSKSGEFCYDGRNLPTPS